jgi:patatin-like phospholipase/acyl hydrolase
LGVAHEKTEYRLFRRLHDILQPAHSEEGLKRLHEADGNSFWFGAFYDQYGDPYLTDGSIYSSLISQAGHSEGGHKYPQLVSFIGQTNAGKSTLLKMLIDQEERKLWPDDQSTFPSPVVGSASHEYQPTSANVHLYADPRSISDTSCSMPLFFADCEGLDAGEKTPRAETVRRSAQNQEQSLPTRLDWGRKRTLAWAETDEMRARQFIVKQLYPRILYTFSDVVVFVLRNSKTFERTALSNLLQWGENSLETSINQPVLPHAIIVLNASRKRRSGHGWDTAEATRDLLDSVDTSFGQDPDIIPLIRKWRRRGKDIRRCRELIECYYASFKVVKIPMEEQGQYNQIADQITALREEIDDCCKRSFNVKREARRLSDADELDVYLQFAFDHFAEYLTRPYDFIEVSRRHNPVPENFGDHILQLAKDVQAQANKKTIRVNGAWVFGKISRVVSSSVLLECTRYHKGHATLHFKQYNDYFDDALYYFFQEHYPCEFELSNRRCVNLRGRHRKGHQDAGGRVIQAGEYISKFTYTNLHPIWMKNIESDLENLERKLQDLKGEYKTQSLLDDCLALQLHSQSATALYDQIGSSALFLSHMTCFSCLMAVPQHPLPCGHVLCTKCIKGHGQIKKDVDDCVNHNYEIRKCPLHANSKPWRPRFVVRFKPDLAGVRALSLDGGGIRGIIELEVLYQIHREMERNELIIPLSAFFDLIVGTSTGAIIALCLATKTWNLRKCVETFKHLCDQAFTPRGLFGIPVLQFATHFRHGGSQYKTRPLYRALRKALGARQLFGHTPYDSSHKPKVAVTSTEASGKKAIVIANYNRPDLAQAGKVQGGYEFLRPGDPSCEFTVWEAAAASTAAPKYFKRFNHQQTGRFFLDGALYHNNPARVVQSEVKALWPDTADQNPDLFLSIGTGQYKDQIDHEKRDKGESENSAKNERTYGPFAASQVLRVLTNRIGNILNAEKAWDDFLEHVEQQPNHDKRRYIRINPDLRKEPPKLDAKGEVQGLHHKTKQILQKSENQDIIRDVAMRLIASSFYFVKTSKTTLSPGIVHTFTGKICCRFENGSRKLRRMGEFLRHQQRPTSQPFFEIENQDCGVIVQKIEISTVLVASMINKSAFVLETCKIELPTPSASIAITLSLRNSRGSYSRYPISGFPRTLPEAPPPTEHYKPHLG